MKDLTYGRVAKLVGHESILRFRNLLRRTPARDPDLGVGSSLRVQAAADVSQRENQQKNRPDFPCACAIQACTMSPY